METPIDSVEIKRQEHIEKLLSFLQPTKDGGKEVSWTKNRAKYLEINNDSVVSLIPKLIKKNSNFLIQTVNLLHVKGVFTVGDYATVDLQKMEGTRRWGQRNYEIAKVLKEMAVFETH